MMPWRSMVMARARRTRGSLNGGREQLKRRKKLPRYGAEWKYGFVRSSPMRLGGVSPLSMMRSHNPAAKKLSATLDWLMGSASTVFRRTPSRPQ